MFESFLNTQLHVKKDAQQKQLNLLKTKTRHVMHKACNEKRTFIMFALKISTYVFLQITLHATTVLQLMLYLIISSAWQKIEMMGELVVCDCDASQCLEMKRGQMLKLVDYFLMTT